MNATRARADRIDAGDAPVRDRRAPDRGRISEEFVVCTIAAATMSGLVMIGTAMEPVNPMRLQERRHEVRQVRAGEGAVEGAAQRAGRHIPERSSRRCSRCTRAWTRVLEIKHGAGAAAVGELPPPVDTPRAKELERECRRRSTPRSRRCRAGSERCCRASSTRSCRGRGRRRRRWRRSVDALLSLREALHIEEGE
jgi:hypothetical protein